MREILNSNLRLKGSHRQRGEQAGEDAWGGRAERRKDLRKSWVVTRHHGIRADSVWSRTVCFVNLIPHALTSSANGLMVSPTMTRPVPETLSGLLEQQAAQSPNAPALFASGTAPATFADLAAWTSQRQSELARFGLGPANRVALSLPDGPWMAAAFLTLGAHVAVAPLNPAYRREELAFYLSDLGARAILLPEGADTPAREVARDQALTVLELRRVPAGPAGAFELLQTAGPRLPAIEALPPGPGPQDIALLLHTSGTTSKPKLVPLTHRNLRVSGRNIARTLALSPDDRGLSVMPLFHIHGLLGMLLSSVTAGASVACTPGFASRAFFPWLREFRPTWYSAVPTMHQAILERAEADALTATALAGTGLRFIRSSSAALPPLVMERLEALFGVPVLESYGMTEASHQMASNPLPPAPRKPGSVGLPAGPDIAILDEQGRPLPCGTQGEVCIRGDSVTQGYDHNPVANDAAFTAEGWFRTGDQGRFDNEGYLFLTGRLKEIVNRGGEKIGPREIDEALLEHPSIRQAVAFGVPHPTLGEDLAAAVVPIPPVPTEQELRSFLLARLPPFKVPSRILLLPEIPKGPTGKVQRLGLAARLTAHFQVPYVPPHPGLETQVATAFCEILGLAQVGRDDHFFSLGGDSLRATRVTARLSPLVGFEVPPTALFQHPTVARLVAALADLRPSPGEELDTLAEALARLPPEEQARVLGDLPPATS